MAAPSRLPAGLTLYKVLDFPMGCRQTLPFGTVYRTCNPLTK